MSTGLAEARRRSSPAAEANSPRRGAEDETPLHVAGDQAVVLERDGEAVDGGPRQMGCGHQLRERLRTGFQSAENGSRLVEHSDARAVVS